MLMTLVRRGLYWLFIWPLLFILLGIWVRGRDKFPRKGPAILYANHNSHLDFLVIMAVCPSSLRHQIWAVGAEDYFFGTKLRAWISRNVLCLLPMSRKPGRGQLINLERCSEVLTQGQVLVIFPEGSRGEPECLAEIKNGIAHLAQSHPDVPVVPIWLHGLGKALPRGDGLLVPIRCDAVVGEPFKWTGERGSFMERARVALEELRASLNAPEWV